MNNEFNALSLAILLRSRGYDNKELRIRNVILHSALYDSVRRAKKLLTMLFHRQCLKVVHVERDLTARMSKDGRVTFQGRLLYRHRPTDSKIRPK